MFGGPMSPETRNISNHLAIVCHIDGCKNYFGRGGISLVYPITIGIRRLVYFIKLKIHQLMSDRLVVNINVKIMI